MPMVVKCVMPPKSPTHAPRLHFETLAVHAGRQVDPATGAIAPAIHLSTTFERDADGGYSRGYIYARNHNPNRNALEQALTALEKGVEAAAFASGLAAISAVLQTLKPGEHVLAPQDMYHGTANTLKQVFSRWGLAYSFVDMSDLDAVRAGIGPQTRLLWLETPSNPLLRCTDIAAVVQLCADLRTGAGPEARIRVVADNTFATPALQNPLALGCDMVVHASTKYLGGHSDVMGGVVVAREMGVDFEAVRTAQVFAGGVPSPFDCWLLLRSLASLPQRMAAHCANARKLAQFLHEHPKVSAVHYPGLPDNRFHLLAQRQMRDAGGMLSFELAGGQDAAMALAANVNLLTRATSLGGVESLIEHRASIEGAGSTTPPGLLRVSTGLEHADDLIDDLAQALERISGAP